MDVIVQKYGGSSVATFDRLETVADEIAASRRTGASVVVVVSAMGGSTDELVEMGRRAWNSQGALANRPAQPPARELDMLVSTGERISMTLLSIMLQARGLDAISFTGSQSGIVTTERHFDARIVDVRPFRIQEQLEQGKIVIVAGFQGVSREKEVTTLGRGGSDTSAVALAAALGASSCEVCSDVDGVYSADPRHIDAAIHLPSVSYEHILEMAESGAKVLHSEAIRYAQEHSVKILAKRTGDRLKDGSRHTTVTEASSAPQGAVVTDHSVLVFRTASHHVEKVIALLDQFGLKPWDVSVPAASPTSGDEQGHGAWVSVRARDVANRDSVESQLREALKDVAQVESDWKSVSLILRNLANSAQTIERAKATPSEAQGLVMSHVARLTRLLPSADDARQLSHRWHELMLDSLR
jgi:aspartate kinase